MKKYVSLIVLLVSLICVIGCNPGLGPSIDLEAPTIRVTQMTSDSKEIDESNLVGLIFCKRNVSFSGIATDNERVEEVYTEIKWSDESDFSYFAPAEYKNGEWSIDLNFERQGTVYVKFVVADKRNNFGINTTKVITLGVDDNAPVGEAWYIDRKLNGIQYSLKTKKFLEEVDLTLSENKDVAQNGTFEIRAAFNDTMGIANDSISIDIYENDKKILTVPNTGTLYSPKFIIKHNELVDADSSLESGKHYLQIKYNASDIVSVPDANVAESVAVDGGYFLWWPESDFPKITTTPAAEEYSKTINLNVKDVVNLTLFDDDAISKAYCALLTEEEYKKLDKQWAENPSNIKSIIEGENSARYYSEENFSKERDTMVPLKALDVPQKMYLVAYLEETNGKTITIDIPVNVVDATKPILFISSPENNTIPKLVVSEDNKKAIMTIEGEALDTSGCKYLEFLWIPNSVTTSGKDIVGKEYLDKLDQESEHEELKPEQDAKSELTKIDNVGVVWSVKLDETKDAGSGFKTQGFEFEIDLFKDFVFNDKDERNEEKYLLVKLTRNDGQVTYQEYKLRSDTDLPKIELVDGKGETINDMQVIPTLEDFTLRFKGKKESKLPMDDSKYEIKRTDIDGEDLKAVPDEDGYVKYTITKEELQEMAIERIKPTYYFSATDLFDKKGEVQYSFVISDLPRLTSITSTSPSLCKVEKEIEFNANFSDTVVVNSANELYLELLGFTDKEGNPITKNARYVSGSGTPTLTFEYVVQEGDLAPGDGIIVKNDAEKGPISGSDKITSTDGSPVHVNTLLDENNLKGKTITIDGVTPTIEKIEIKTYGNEVDGKTYLKAGKTLTVNVTISEEVFESKIPNFDVKVVKNEGSEDTIKIPFKEIDGNVISFEKEIKDEDINGTVKYDESTCISEFKYISDAAENILKTPSPTTITTAIVVDTISPSTPKIKIDNDEILGDELKSKGAVEFTLDTESGAITKYLKDDEWHEYNTGEVIKFEQSGSFLAKRVDYAGNESDPREIYFEIRDGFPAYFVECKTPDGNYKTGDKIEFKVYFEDDVKVPSDFSEKLKFHCHKKDSDVIRVAELKTEKGTTTNVLTFEYTEESTEVEYSLKFEKDSIELDLTGFVDTYNADWDPNKLGDVFISEKVIFDTIAPKVVSAIPNNGAVSPTNVYQNGNVIKIVFSEPVQKGSGNIILQQTKDWAIPPVLTVDEFNTICSKLNYTQKNELARQDENGNLLKDAVDDRIANKQSNDEYYGTGQYIGPYKKSMYGLKEVNGEYVPDTDVSFVLDFDIGIWETDKVHKIGTTYTGGEASTKGEKKDRTYASPTEETSAGKIRGILEDAGMHKRVLDVTSLYVEIADDNKTVTITFPKGLIDEDDALPKGREWELVFERGTFKDDTGNDFVSTESASRKDEYGLIKINGVEGAESSFYSDGVATPVIRVDRYSYGLQIRQPNDKGVLEGITSDKTAPSNYVRVRIDCETEDAEVYCSFSEITKTISDATEKYTMTADEKRETKYSQSKITKLPSVNTTTDTPLYTVSPNDSGEMNKSIFVVNTGDYKTACKTILVTQGKKDSVESEMASEGIFKTVLYISEFERAGNGEVSIRGTTGMGGQPSIAPFPLRDSAYGSPYLRRAYRYAKETFYWVSYEILLKSSFSGYFNNNWSSTWGILYPGEFSNIEDMRGYGSDK